MEYVSRAGAKLEFALNSFKINPTGYVCADFGSNTGGFVDCLLQHGAIKVYSIETGYGVLDWKLRNDERVVVMERTNAMHVVLPELMDFICIDTSWTKIENIISSSLRNIKKNGQIVVLVKPHYEAEKHMLHKGKLKDEYISHILTNVREKLDEYAVDVLGEIESPILGEKAKNKEYLLYLRKRD